VTAPVERMAQVIAK